MFCVVTGQLKRQIDIDADIRHIYARTSVLAQLCPVGLGVTVILFSSVHVLFNHLGKPHRP